MSMDSNTAMQMLKGTLLEPDFPFQILAERSSGLSGSDLKELCRNAAMMPVRDYVRATGDDQALLAKGQLEVRCLSLCSQLTHDFFQGFRLRPLSINDFFDSEPTTSSTGKERTEIDEGVLNID
jgi:SpoVK/Ycf46/Vps4 family AAA+-type ATPase